MHAVGQQDDVGLGGGVDPDRRSGEAGVAVGADGEQFAAVARSRGSRCPSRGRAGWADRAASWAW